MGVRSVKVVDIADEIFRELGEPSALSIPAISFWIRTNIGTLNSLIYQNFTINTSYEVDREDPEDAAKVIDIDEEAISILKKMYLVHFYGMKVRETMDAASTDSVLSVENDGVLIRKINKNELSKTYASMRKQEQEDLIYLSHSYKIGEAHPVQVAGNDTVEGVYSAVRNLRKKYSGELR